MSTTCAPPETESISSMTVQPWRDSLILLMVVIVLIKKVLRSQVFSPSWFLWLGLVPVFLILAYRYIRAAIRDE